jgi:hypothetical protein
MATVSTPNAFFKGALLDMYYSAGRNQQLVRVRALKSKKPTSAHPHW